MLKLHGCIAQERRRHSVLTRSHYLRLSEHRANLCGTVQAPLVTRHMLFVGFDPPRPDRLGTALVLQRDQIQEGLWSKDVGQVAMVEEGGTLKEAARLIELFLGALLAARDVQPELPVRPALRRAAHLCGAGAARRPPDGLRDGPPDSPVGARVHKLLGSFGWKGAVSSIR